MILSESQNRGKTVFLCGMVFMVGALASSDSVYAGEGIKFTPYGFFSPMLTGASRALDSFGNTNMTAPTAIAAPVITADFDRARSNFQVAQSRLGVRIEEEKIASRFEFDFINFNVASPTTVAGPRLRIANIDYQATPYVTLSFGQDWDLFAAPSKPFTWNFIGLFFRAGNVGFIRQQARIAYEDDDWKFQAAIGYPSQNSTSTDTELELGGIPTGVVSAIKKISAESSAGISILGGSVRSGALPAPLAGVYGINTFYSYHGPSGFKLHESIYFGQNLGSVGASTLAFTSNQGMRHDMGGYLSFQLPLSKWFSVQGGIGGAKVIETDGSPIDGNAAQILFNSKVEASLVYHPEEALSFYLQPTFMQTAYLLTASNQVANANAVALQMGAFYQF